MSEGVILSEVKSIENNYIEFTRKLNVGNISKFSLAVCIVCLLILSDTSGPHPLVKHNHILIPIILRLFFLLGFCVFGLH